MHVVWYSPTEVYSFKPKSFINTKIMRSVTKKLGTYFQKCRLSIVIFITLINFCNISSAVLIAQIL